MFKVECSFPRRRRKTVWLDEKVLHLGFSLEIYIEMSISPLLKPFHVSIRLLGSQGTKRAGECECLKAQPHPDPDLPQIVKSALLLPLSGFFFWCIIVPFLKFWFPFLFYWTVMYVLIVKTPCLPSHKKDFWTHIVWLSEKDGSVESSCQS